MKSTSRGNANTLMLSFDDSPSQEDVKVLEILKKHKIKAAFFVIGKEAEAHPHLLQKINEEGHTIGNHSYSHENKIGWSPQNKVQAEIQKCNEVIHSLIGITPELYRPPFGVTNPIIARAIKAERMKSIGWSIRTYDTTNITLEKLTRRTLDKIDGAGHIILFHSHGQHTAELLLKVIEHAGKNGIEIVNFEVLD